MQNLLLTLLSITVLTGTINRAQADITLSSTRVIFEGDKKEASVTVRNLGSNELLIQSWLESSKSTEGDTSIPFAVTPPLAHMAGQGQQVLRFLYQGTGLPTDKESVFWLNVQEIPQAAKETNALQLALRQRIKLFYRPTGLSGTQKNATTALAWNIETQKGVNGLNIKNPTQYHVTISNLSIKTPQYSSPPIDNFMIAPGASTFIAVPGIPLTTPTMLSVDSINDHGGYDSYSTSLASQPVHLKLVN